MALLIGLQSIIMILLNKSKIIINRLHSEYKQGKTYHYLSVCQHASLSKKVFIKKCNL